MEYASHGFFTRPAQVPPAGALNNKGDLVFVSNDGLSLLSSGSVRTLATGGQPVPNSGLVVKAADASIDDDGDIAFVNYVTLCAKVCSSIANGIVRWRRRGTVRRFSHHCPLSRNHVARIRAARRDLLTKLPVRLAGPFRLDCPFVPSCRTGSGSLD